MVSSEEFQRLLVGLTQGETPRVWSLLVTIFGDLAQPIGAQISGTSITQVTENIGIKPEATRVALYRLRKEGWLESHRIGRRSAYALTAWGRAQSAAATPRIYAVNSVNKAAWLILRPPAQSAEGGLPYGADIGPQIRVETVASRDPQVISIPLSINDKIPNWVAEKICAPTLAAQSADLEKRLTALQLNLPDASELTTLQIITLRVLIVHSWRRVILKAPDLPDHVFPHSWKGADCRAAVADLLSRLPRGSIETVS